MAAFPGVWPFNNVVTQNGYVTAVTAVFPIGRPSFSVQVYGAGIFYKLIAFRPPTHYYVVETEHFFGPILANFKDPVEEGLERGEIFGGILFRSSALGIPASVTVI